MEYYRKYIVDGYLEKPDEAKMDVADDKGPTMEEIDKGSNSINSWKLKFPWILSRDDGDLSKIFEKLLRTFLQAFLSSLGEIG